MHIYVITALESLRSRVLIPSYPKAIFSVYSSNLTLLQYLKQLSTNKNGVAKVLGRNKYNKIKQLQYTKLTFLHVDPIFFIK